MYEPLSGSSEALAALGTGVGLGARMYPLMNCLLAGFNKCFGTETAFVRFRVLVHSRVSVIATCKSKQI